MQGWKDVAQTLCARDYKDPKIVAIPVLTPDREEKRQNGRRFKEDGDPMFTLTGQDKHGVMVKEATKKGYAEAYPGDSINLEQPNSTTRRGRVGVGVAQTLTTSCNQAVVEHKYRIRKLTPKECFRLMGLTDQEIDTIQATGISNSQQYKMAGNSIVVNVLVEIFKILFLHQEPIDDQMTIDCFL
jgi:DNA (cytosine-5)-methyltransferase 1